jgi:predicted transcriptional regulator
MIHKNLLDYEVLYKVLYKISTAEMGKYDEAVYSILFDPVTPNEVAKKLGVTQKTAQRVLMHLALTRKDVKYKNSGRIHIFWKEKES